MSDTADRRSWPERHVRQDALVHVGTGPAAGGAPDADQLTSVGVISSVSRTLFGSLDVVANVAELARLVVPFLGSWSIVSVVDRDGVLRDAGSWHVDPLRRSDVAAYSQARLGAFVDESFVAEVARTGATTLLDVGAYNTIRMRMAPGPGRDLLDTLRPEFVAILPMIARGRTVGLLSLYSDRPWTSNEREVAEDIVARAALVIDNSFAYEGERAARAAAETAEQRLSLLAQVSETLAGSPDPDVAVGGLARLVVPALADWAFVTVIAEDGSLRDIGLAHRDPAKQDDLAAYSAAHLEAMSEDAAVSRALRTAAPVIVPQLREDILTSFLPDPRVAELTRRLAPYGVASFPLTAGGRTLGALTLATTAPRGGHTEDELALGLEISRRAGPVLGAARAARRARSLAESLQRSMLSTLTPTADLQIRARYRPAYIDSEIGGDWYDAFPVPDGSTMVSIGDVMGHDVAAIAAMAQLRTLLRAVAWTLPEHSPAASLAATDAASVGLGPATFATALVAQLLPAGADGSVEVRWSSAGHPPLVVISPDGDVRTVRPHRIDLPLGVEPARVRHDHTLTLPAGSVLLMLTDGLIERRDRDLDAGLAGVVRVLEGRQDDDLDQLLETLLVEFPGDVPHNDDVALLAVRVGASAPVSGESRTASVRLMLPPTEQAPALARDFVRVHGRQLPDETLDDVLVLVSELVTNATRYARPELRLELTITHDSVRAAVHDGGPELVVRHDGAPVPTSTGGRGLLIVEALASAWGVVHVDGSEAKSVWFEVPIAPGA